MSEHTPEEVVEDMDREELWKLAFPETHYEEICRSDTKFDDEGEPERYYRFRLFKNSPRWIYKQIKRNPSITKEELKNVSLGDTVLSTDISSFMRSRNVEFVSKKVKPLTRLYAFFDGVDISKYCVPKLMEITMESGVFEVGETIVGSISSATHTIFSINNDPVNDGFAQNTSIETEADGILDFTERNPFGMP